MDGLASIKATEPYYLFKDWQIDLTYQGWWSVKDIFSNYTCGLETQRDKVSIHLDKKDIVEVVNSFNNLSEEEIKLKYDLSEDGRDWKVKTAKADVEKHQASSKLVTQVLYRPFDLRWTWYSGKTKGLIAYPRHNVMKHLIRENLALVTSRMTRGETFKHVQVSTHFPEKICMSPKTSNNSFVFPLYLYPETEIEESMGITRHPNLSQLFLNDITDCLGYTPTPEAVFYYIYAIFHSPTYRSRYAEFLKIDFPRVPLTRNDTLFSQLAAYGEELVALHLMKSASLEQKNKLPQFIPQGGKSVVDPAHPKYEVQSRSVVINKKGDRFTNVPKNVWEFYVGGYPVCAKWLKDRKGRTLNPEDIAHYQRIVVALGETIRLMAAIDRAIPKFPIE